jgi:hypothetical protein
MNNHTLKTDSLHFRLANFVERRVSRYDIMYGIDICTYIKYVLKGTLWFLFGMWFIVAGISWVGYSFYDLYQSITTGTQLSVPAFVLFYFTGLLILVLITMALYLQAGKAAKWCKYKLTNITPKRSKPGFVGLAYSKFKDKTCFMIKFEDHHATKDTH